PAVALLAERFAHGANVGLPVRFRVPRAALLDRAALGRRRFARHRFDQRVQARFGIDVDAASDSLSATAAARALRAGAAQAPEADPGRVTHRRDVGDARTD